MLKNLQIKNLRAIQELKINNFSQVNVFVGENGSGKTTLLESIFYLCGATNPELSVSTNAFRGLEIISDELWPAYFRQRNLSNTIEIEATDDQEATHRLNIVPHYKNDKPFEIGSDSVNMISTSGDSILNNNDIYPKNVNGLEFLYSCSNTPDYCHSSKIFTETDKLRLQERKEVPINAVFIRHSGESDWKTKFAIVQRNKKVNEIINLLKEIDPRIEHIVLNEIGLLEVDLGLDNYIPASLLGGGISKFLSIALGMLNFKIVLIDEIENGLHHASQRKIWNAILNWSQKLGVQVFATTHSREAIKAFHDASKENLFASNSKLFRIERENGKCNCIEFTQNELETSITNQWEIR